MNRQKIVFLLLLLIGNMVLITPVGAAGDGCTLRADFAIGDQRFSAGEVIGANQEDGSLICTIDTLYYALDWFFYILITAVGLMILYGSFLIIVSAGNSDRVAQGKRVIIFAVIGLVIGLLVRVIPSIVIYFSGVN